MVKVAICGKMASGKTTLAERFVSEYSDFGRFSLADAVKKFARFVYDIPEGHKDRVAFQKIGDGARRHLYEDIWIHTLFNEVAHHEAVANNDGFIKHFVVDDVRYLNEVIKMKADGWLLVKLDISDDLQIERLKNVYPDDWETHVGARNHSSEAEVDEIPEGLFDVILTASNNEDSFDQLNEFITLMVVSG